MRNIYVLIQLLGIIVLFFYPPIGIIVGLILIGGGGIGYRRETKRIKEEKSLVRCPFCAERIKSEATVCKHCGKDIIKK